MKIRLWQVNPNRNPDRLMFCGLNEWKAVGHTAKENGEAYDMVFEGDVPCEDMKHVFFYFNREDTKRIYNEKPFRSMSISDVVEVLAEDNRVLGVYFCDKFSFTEVSELFVFDLSKVRRVSNHELTLKIRLEEDSYFLRIEEPMTGSSQDYTFPLKEEGDCSALCRILGTNVDSWVHFWKEEEQQ